MADGWAMTVGTTDLQDAVVEPVPIPEPAAGQAVLRVDRVGMTANNVTYALLGKAFRYWDFFPAAPGRGVVPLWGFGEVVASAVDGVAVGDRLYGYYPTASHLLVTPSRVDERGFRDGSEHRAGLPSPYNAYALTTTDPSYSSDEEDLHVLYRPLFFTSFMLADQLEDNGFYDASVLAFSSASSKTSYGAAFLLRGSGRHVVGLTSPGNVEFTRSLGVYDEVHEYGDLSALPTEPTVHLDVAGSSDVRRSLREALGDLLVRESIIGVAHQEKAAAGSLDDPRTVVFFAPDQMRKRTVDWGRDGLDARFGEAWRSFAPFAREHVEVVVGDGPDGLRAAWLEVLANKAAPQVGNVIRL
jgi:NADPH:quinone reductase-like Zn-dependent oxidoreductase